MKTDTAQSQTMLAPKPPFSHAEALAWLQAAQDAWQARNAEYLVRICAPEAEWRVRDRFLQGREAIRAFLEQRWAIELHYQLVNELWSFTGDRIALRSEYEWQSARTGQWFRTHGNDLWQFDQKGYLCRRELSANDIPICTDDRYLCDAGDTTTETG